jgi:hypothetical protein
MSNNKNKVYLINIHQFALLPQDRSVLHERIEQRFDLMLQQGLIEEVTALKQRIDLNLDLPSMRSVGYRQVWEYLNNDYDYDEMRFKGDCGNTTISQNANIHGYAVFGTDVHQLDTQDALIVLQNCLKNFKLLENGAMAFVRLISFLLPRALRLH